MNIQNQYSRRQAVELGATLASAALVPPLIAQSPSVPASPQSVSCRRCEYATGQIYGAAGVQDSLKIKWVALLRFCDPC